MAKNVNERAPWFAGANVLTVPGSCRSGHFGAWRGEGSFDGSTPSSQGTLNLESCNTVIYQYRPRAHTSKPTYIMKKRVRAQILGPCFEADRKSVGIQATGCFPVHKAGFLPRACRQPGDAMRENYRKSNAHRGLRLGASTPGFHLQSVGFDYREVPLQCFQVYQPFEAQVGGYVEQISAKKLAACPEKCQAYPGVSRNIFGIEDGFKV